ncbi:DUF4149 domain-containing protein [Sideroxydans lithotrophicus]|uniref:TMEM205-like domain-containing protein n=1 Tax=Sideroxydans lithotrophicus (strain ES-1) TaxID=580332 RepID=D5CLE2_SIDLE|nr:DUF4149 domain-containing protein [Sideroxydans lithotrophicus]ADE10530.1 conserved hypothetical protein [Sideroxydans lithotrophicus ES-1]
MHNLPRHLAALSVALWVGGMWMLGYVVVPTLFKLLPDRQLAGIVAGHLFTLLAYIGIACALYLLVYQVQQFGRTAIRRRLFRITAVMLSLVLVGQFVLQPILADLKQQALPLDVMQSAFASQFRTWHGISGILFLIQSLLGIALVIDSRKQ